jgi:hypothetical protein
MHMNPMIGVGGENSLLSILINLAFGFVAGLMVFIGFSEVLAFGTTLAEQLLALSGYGQQMAAFGIATTAAPYVVKQLAGVRSLKSFAFFAAAVLVGVAAAYFSQGYIVSLIEAA